MGAQPAHPQWHNHKWKEAPGGFPLCLGHDLLPGRCHTPGIILRGMDCFFCFPVSIHLTLGMEPPVLLGICLLGLAKETLVSLQKTVSGQK